MEKSNMFLLVTFSNGRIFKIPASIIAESRATYYACQVDGEKYNSQKWIEEYEYSLNDSLELIDWAYNNMEWKDVKDLAIEVKNLDDVDYDKEWSNCGMTIKFDKN